MRCQIPGCDSPVRAPRTLCEDCYELIPAEEQRKLEKHFRHAEGGRGRTHRPNDKYMRKAWALALEAALRAIPPQPAALMPPGSTKKCAIFGCSADAPLPCPVCQEHWMLIPSEKRAEILRALNALRGPRGDGPPNGSAHWQWVMREAFAAWSAQQPQKDEPSDVGREDINKTQPTQEPEPQPTPEMKPNTITATSKPEPPPSPKGAPDPRVFEPRRDITPLRVVDLARGPHGGRVGNEDYAKLVKAIEENGAGIQKALDDGMAVAELAKLYGMPPTTLTQALVGRGIVVERPKPEQMELGHACAGVTRAQMRDCMLVMHRIATDLGVPCSELEPHLRTLRPQDA